MIHDVDESLRALIEREVLNGAGVEISFEAPNRDWSSRRSTPTLNLYLYDIREDLQRRPAQFEETRDADGRVVSRTMPPRRFRLSYLVTAWTQRAEDEHRLLSAALSCFVTFDGLPEDLLRGSLRESPIPIRTTVALPLPEERSLSDVWSALGGELKPSLDLVVTVPFAPSRYQEVGPPVTEEPFVRLGAQGTGGLEEAQRRAGQGKGQAGGEGVPDGPAEVRDVAQGGRDKVGRRIEVVSVERP